MRTIQFVDDAPDATFSLFEAEEAEFAALFPDGRDMVLADDVEDRLGRDRAEALLERIRQRPVLKRDARGLHGTIFFGWSARRGHLPASGREMDWDGPAINPAQRRLFAARREAERAAAAEAAPGTAGRGCLVAAIVAAGLGLTLAGRAGGPWFLILWGAMMLLPLVVRRPGFWAGRPIARAADPGRFWTSLLLGLMLILGGLALVATQPV